MAQRTTVADLAVEIAIGEARKGVIESAGENRGPEVDVYQLAANNAVGQSGCAKFVWWCFERASLKLRVRNPFPRIFQSAALQVWAARERKVVREPGRGDVFVRQQKHTGLATGGLLSGGFVPAVEGNTWIGQPRKPDGVYETRKTPAAQCPFIRF
jgi:hypothetical protein